ncbi:4-hydroxybutyrate dehydrogenase [[Clostridium] fimetarium]|uniref:4-hydroxybutyrate dehydrogenase n=1 Tax=[Clostridium] fimetarium TaxID=99656 RepID=A0A1I0RFK7_9FIRM|nr:4-hydroxybutyrate dehydrogenase [[Clostridium] fimetarium]SEW39653.1 4-hydroxybutyrate dehydrogenase [[Clostridium] fimetarium]
MQKFNIFPTIEQFESCEEFLGEFGIGKGDLVFISDSTRDFYFTDAFSDALVVNYRKYGSGEPTDTMVENIYNDISGYTYNRVFAIGGGTILDVAKLFSLKKTVPVLDLFDRKFEIVKNKELILVPTTCGTGSEVTNISILELTAINTKMGLAVDELYADYAVLIPELISNLPFKYFATSSIDALIHSIESYTSPKATEFSKLFSEKAMRMILSGYKEIIKKGPEIRNLYLNDFLIASTYAGIAFGNAGCAAVHAMSYPIGATYHVPHGEANYLMFTEVYKTYQALNPNGIIKNLNHILAEILECEDNLVYIEIEKLLDNILPRKPLHLYNVTENDLLIFTNTVMTKQSRLMANNYAVLDKETVLSIYTKLY